MLKLKETLKERIERAKEILQNILVTAAEEGIHDNDVERAYNILDGAD